MSGAKILGENSACKFASNNQVIEELKIDSYRKKYLADKKTYQLKSFKITPFNLLHGSRVGKFCDHYGYLLENELGEKLVYMTDTGDINMKVRNAEVYIIEANYNRLWLDKQLEDGLVADAKYRRLTSLNGHLSVEESVQYLNECAGDKTKLIIIMHAHGGIEKIIESYVKENLKSSAQVVVLKSHELLYEEYKI